VVLYMWIKISAEESRAGLYSIPVRDGDGGRSRTWWRLHEHTQNNPAVSDCASRRNSNLWESVDIIFTTLRESIIYIILVQNNSKRQK
jgi:hypothetical protein